MRRRKILSLILIAGIVVSLYLLHKEPGVMAETTDYDAQIKKVEETKKEAQERVDELKKDIDSLEKEKEDILNYVKKVDEKIEDVSNTMKKLDGQIKDARKEIVTQIVMINNLTDENEALSVENSTLSNKVAVLSETVSKKAATEDAISQETAENALPKGFPLSGSAAMEEAGGEELMLIFSASPGVNVITSGTGTVVSVDADEEYGTKVIIDHGNGYQSVYRNNGTALVKNGEELGKGYILFSIEEENQKLGYQVLKDDVLIDPMQVIEING